MRMFLRMGIFGWRGKNIKFGTPQGDWDGRSGVFCLCLVHKIGLWRDSNRNIV